MCVFACVRPCVWENFCAHVDALVDVLEYPMCFFFFPSPDLRPAGGSGRFPTEANSCKGSPLVVGSDASVVVCSDSVRSFCGQNLIFQTKYVELLLARRTVEAMSCLRLEVTPVLEVSSRELAVLSRCVLFLYLKIFHHLPPCCVTPHAIVVMYRHV